MAVMEKNELCAVKNKGECEIFWEIFRKADNEDASTGLKNTSS